MSELVIEPVDPHDGDAFDAAYDVYLAALNALDGTASPWMREEMRTVLQDRAVRRWAGAFLGTVDGVAVATGVLRVPLLDNVSSAELEVLVLPAAQRRGHGAAMLAHVEAEAAARGRTLLQAEAAWSYDAGADGIGVAGAEFARSHGYVLGISDVKRELGLPIADALLEALAAEAAPHHAAYTLCSWVGPVPDDLAEGWMRLTSTLMTEAPTGGMEREPEDASTVALRENEAMVAVQGRTKFNTVALDAAGEVVAYSDIVTSVHEPGRAYQWGTLVRRDARGHRLGLAVKVANHRLLQHEQPDLSRIVTYNAEVNDQMIGVNERLGYVPVARLGEFQKRVRT